MKKVAIDALLAEGPWLRQLAAHLAHGGAEAEDLIQETWLAALRAPPDPGRAPRPWLARVLSNAWRMTVRSTSRRRLREREVAQPPVGHEAGADELLQRLSLHRRLTELLTALEEPYRTALLLRYCENDGHGMTAAAVARRLNVPAGTVRWRVCEGLARLRARLDEQTGGERARWRVWLIPLAGSAQKPGGSFPRWAPGLLLAGATVTVGAGAVLWWAGPQRPAADRGGQHALAVPASRISYPRTGAAITPNHQEARMRNANLTRTAAFIGVALPALVATAGNGGRELTRDEHIQLCVERTERLATCREEFAAYMSTKAPPKRREVARQKLVAELQFAAAATREERAASCAASIDRGDLKLTDAAAAETRACLVKPDCQQVVDCLKPQLDRAPAKKTGR